MTAYNRGIWYRQGSIEWLLTGNDILDQKNEWESQDIENQEQKIQSSIAQGAIPGLRDKRASVVVELGDGQREQGSRCSWKVKQGPDEEWSLF